MTAPVELLQQEHAIRLISVTDEELATLDARRRAVATGRCSAFLRNVADALHQHPEMGHGVITRITREIRRLPDLAHGSGTSKYR
jgi:hypothetical protein